MASDDPWINFGLWSAAGIQNVSDDLLRPLGVRFYIQELAETEQVLRDWYAWDETSERPNIGFQLWIHEHDRDIVGDKIVAAFPERKFGA